MERMDDKTTSCWEKKSEQRTVSCIPSQKIFEGERRVLIEHSGVLYSLQVTQSGKLILTK
jgi:hemin uptake protein HemP